VKKLSLVFMLVLTLAASFAQTPIPFTATYSFAGSTGSTLELAYNGTQYSGISMGNIVKNGVASVDSENNFRATGWHTHQTNMNTNMYISFAISAVPGYKFSIDTITFGIGRDADGATKAVWKAGEVYLTNIKSYHTKNENIEVSNNGIITIPTEGSWTGNVISLASDSGYQDVTTIRNFRLYMYVAKSAAGIAGLDGPITITGTYTFSGTHPAIEVSPGSLTGFTYEQGSGTSTPQSFTVSGAGLGANESILLTAPNSYGLSLTEAGPYYATSGVVADGSGNVAPTTVYVRLNEGLSAGDYSGNIEATYSNVTRYVSLSGSVTEQTLPVTLSHFSATLTAQNYVLLTWTSQSESNLLGYNVYRNESHDLSSAVRISDTIAGTNTSQAQVYTYYDQELDDAGTYYYWLQSMDLDGSACFFGPVSVAFSTGGEAGSPGIPTITQLENAYPNPFNPSTTIHYQLKDPGKVEIDIYNVKGHRVHSFSRYHDTPGRYGIVWDGCDDSGNALASGVYLYKMRSGSYSAIKKLVLQK
jgi:hypothetical protein